MRRFVIICTNFIMCVNFSSMYLKNGLYICISLWLYNGNQCHEFQILVPKAFTAVTQFLYQRIFWIFTTLFCSYLFFQKFSFLLRFC